jgi:hypothetical protein
VEKPGTWLEGKGIVQRVFTRLPDLERGLGEVGTPLIRAPTVKYFPI